LVTQPKYLLHGATSQIEVSVLEAKFFACVQVIDDFEGWGFGLIEYLGFEDAHFDLAGGSISIEIFSSGNDDAADSDDPFRSNLLCDCDCLGDGFGAIHTEVSRFRRGIEDHLCQTFPIAKIDEYASTQVAPCLYPAK